MVQKFPLLEVVQACHSLLIPTGIQSTSSQFPLAHMLAHVFILFNRRRLHFSTEGVYIFLRKAFIFFYGRRLHFATEGVYILLRKAFTFFYGRRLYFSTESARFLRKSSIYKEGSSVSKEKT